MENPQGKTEWTKERASAVQSAEAKKNDGKIEKGSHAPKAQSHADKNEGQWSTLVSHRDMLSKNS